MSSGRLQQQFIHLWQYCDGKAQDATLNKLVDLLGCPRRHIRTLLNTMQDHGWLTWETEVGRDKRLRLTFFYTGLTLQQQRAEDLLEQDHIGQPVQLVGDKTAARQMLVPHLGHSFRQGRHVIRVLRYRPMHDLLLGTALRRSETHIARQILSASIWVNRENRELGTDIIHHWQQISLLHQRFFLCPGIHFHHGRGLEMEDVIASLRYTNTSPLCLHITQVISPTVWTPDIRLAQPDRWLPWLLGQVPAMILPRGWETLNNFFSHPVGTGPYAVMRSTNDQLKIHALDDYFNYRALVDGVNVWVLPDIGEEPGGGLTLKDPTEDGKVIENRLEEGCYHLMFDVHSRRGVNQEVREQANRVLSPTSLTCHADEQYQRLWFPAHGLPPRWHHAKPDHGEKLAGLKTLTIICYRDHIEHRTVAQITRTLLAQRRVQLNIQEIDCGQWHAGEIVSDI